jgi:IclR family transcriptional regulator, KDG regulon repressor
LGKAVLAWLPQAELQAYFERILLNKYTPHTITDRELLVKDLEASRLRGYSIDKEELITGLVCFGAPIFDQDGDAVGSLSVSFEREVFDSDRITEITDALILTATEISHALGHYPKIRPM